MAKGPLKLAAAPKLPASLVTQSLDPATLFRVSSYDTGEPFFGTFDSNRFDDPNPTPANRYGTCYLGTSLAVVLFDRARAKLTMIGADSLLGHPDFGQAGTDLFIRS
jgi:hypothetical protein